MAPARLQAVSISARKVEVIQGRAIPGPETYVKNGLVGYFKGLFYIPLGSRQ